MDPVSQTLAQQQSGSAGGQGFGQFFVAGQQAGFASRRLDLEERQERRMQRREDVMLPLEKQVKEYAVIDMGIRARANADKFNSTVYSNAILPELYQLEMAFAQSPLGYEDPEIKKQVWELQSRFPRAFAKGLPGGDLLQNMIAVPMQRREFQLKLDMLEKVPAGTSVTGVGSRDFPPRTATDTTADIRNAQYQASLETAISLLPESPERSNLQRQLDTFKEGRRRSTVESEVGRRITELERRLGRKLPDDEVQRMYEIAGGLEPRAAVTQPPITEADYITKHIDKAMEQTVIITDQATGRARLPKNRTEATDYLSGEYRKLYGKQPASSAAPPPTASTPATGEELIWVISPEGKRGTIPRNQWEKAKALGYKEFEG